MLWNSTTPSVPFSENQSPVLSRRAGTLVDAAVAGLDQIAGRVEDHLASRRAGALPLAVPPCGSNATMSCVRWSHCGDGTTVEVARDAGVAAEDRPGEAVVADRVVRLFLAVAADVQDVRVGRVHRDREVDPALGTRRVTRPGIGPVTFVNVPPPV